MELLEFISKELVEVKNVSGEYYDPGNAIEWYFNKHTWSSAKCPSCGKRMYRKKHYGQKHPIMVGGHVEILNIDFFKGKKYIIPICEECNNKKNNLKPFKVPFGWLKIAPHSTQKSKNLRFPLVSYPILYGDISLIVYFPFVKVWAAVPL